MSDGMERQLRAFVAELVADPPEPPPLPTPDTLVIAVSQSDWRRPMTGTKTDDLTSQHQRWWRGPTLAVTAFATIVVVAAALVAVSTLNDPPPATEPATTAPEAPVAAEEAAMALVGTIARVTDGLAGSRPNRIEFGEGGTYRVIDAGYPVATGEYVADGSIITFEAAPTEEVAWVHDDVWMRIARSCAGLIGEYRVVVSDTATYMLDAVWDECQPRINIANGLELEIVD